MSFQVTSLLNMSRVLLCVLLSCLATKSFDALAADCSALLVEHRAADLNLSLNAFDQDDKAGWRQLERAGCESEAADLIEAYVTQHPHPVLTWHRAQMLANAGRTAEAIEAARLTLRPAEGAQASGFDWNDYANATIAFLQGDRRALQTSRDRLAIAADKMEFNVPNLRAVDRLLQCFGQPYKAAYACLPVAP